MKPGDRIAAFPQSKHVPVSEQMYLWAQWEIFSEFFLSHKKMKEEWCLARGKFYILVTGASILY